MSKLIRLEISLPAGETQPGFSDQLTAYLAQNVAHGWEELNLPGGELVFRLHLPQSPASLTLCEDIAARWPGLARAQGEVEDEDWMSQWKKFFTPLKIGPVFEILPPWLAEQGDPAFTPIVIEPKMAFGTGHHPTTAMCLAELSRLAKAGRLKPGQYFLDLGTGSGILGIGLAKLGLRGLGLDTDPLAIECALENAEINKADSGLRIKLGGLESLGSYKVFDVVVANILAAPLIEMAPDLAKRLAPGGVLVLSGILSEQAPAVAAAYQAQGLAKPEISYEKEWAVLVWQ